MVLWKLAKNWQSEENLCTVHNNVNYNAVK